MMKIKAITIGSYPVGEARTNRNVSLLKGLIEAGHQVKLLVVSPSNNRFHERREQRGCIGRLPYEYMSCSTKLPGNFVLKTILILQSIVKTISQLYRSNKKIKIDAILILLTQSYIIYPLIIFANVFKIKIIHERTEHPEIGHSGGGFISKFNKALYFRLLPKFTGMYVINTYLKKFFTKYLGDSKICVVNMTVDISRFNSSKASPFGFKYMAYCGTLHGNKDGLEDLIRIYRDIKDELDFKLVLIGDINDKRVCDLLELVRQCDLQNDIIFTGLVNSEDMPSYLQNAEILLLSRPDNLQARGGFPTKLGEYLMTGKPVLVSSVGEIPLFLEDNVSAFLAKPGDIDGFVKKIREINENYERALEIGMEGKKVAIENFNYLTESLKLSKFIETI